MNTSRNFLLVLCLVSLLTSGLWAQNVVPTITADKELTDLLQLSPEQVAELEAVESATQEKMTALRQNGSEVREEARATRRAHNDAVNNILTEEQQAQLRTYRQDQRNSRREELKSVDWEGMRAELKTYQETTIDPVMRAQRAQLERKLSKDDRESLVALREELKATRSAQRAARRGDEATEDVEEEQAVPAEPAAKPGRRAARRGKDNRGAARGGMDADTRDALELMEAKYADEINALFADIAPQRTQWEAAKAEIRAKYMPERPGKRPQATAAEMGGEKVVQRNIAFLLLKPEK